MRAPNQSTLIDANLQDFLENEITSKFDFKLNTVIKNPGLHMQTMTYVSFLLKPYFSLKTFVLYNGIGVLFNHKSFFFIFIS